MAKKETKIYALKSTKRIVKIAKVGAVKIASAMILKGVDLGNSDRSCSSEGTRAHGLLMVCQLSVRSKDVLSHLLV